MAGDDKGPHPRTSTVADTPVLCGSCSGDLAQAETTSPAQRTIASSRNNCAAEDPSVEIDMIDDQDQDKILNVAFVTARYPPMRSTGTIRVETLRSHLEDFRVIPTWVTIPLSWVSQQGPAYNRDTIKDEPGVLRPTAATDVLMRLWAKVPVLRRFQRWIFVPDILVAWSHSIARKVSRNLSHVDAIYVTSPPFSAMAAGRKLSKILSVPLIIELRDPPTLDRRAAGRGNIYLRRLAAFQSRSITGSDLVVVLTPGVKKHIQEVLSFLPNRRILVIPNSSGTMPADKRKGDRRSEKDRFSIVYTGSLRSDHDLIILKEIAECLMTLPTPGILRLVGNYRQHERSALRQEEQNGSLEWVGWVPQHQALLEMRDAGASLAIAGEDEHWWIGRKVLESVVHARQILAVAPPGDLNDLLQLSSKSVVVDRNRTGTTLQDAVNLLYLRSRGENQLDASEPRVPSDTELAEAVSGAIRSVVVGAEVHDWEWDGNPISDR